MPPTVLVVDDEAGIVRLLRLELEAQGFRVMTAPDGPTALRLAAEEPPDIFLLDVLMPGMSGMDVLQQLKRMSNLPVILITARDSDQDIVAGLDAGADDYIGKPFSPEEVGARIRSVLRRSLPAAEPRPVLYHGDLTIDLERRLVLRGGETVALTRNEWRLLEYLAERAGRTVPAREILHTVWGPEFALDLQYLRVWISRLRRKLEADPANPALLMNVPGVGYQLNAQPAS